MSDLLKKHLFVLMLLLAPAVLIVAVFVIYPLANGVRLSFTDSSPMSFATSWIGIRNFHELLTDAVFWEVLFNTVVLVGTSILISTVCGFLIALLLNTKLRGSIAFRAGVFQVWIVPWIAVAILWSWLFNADYGVLNQTFQLVGLIDKPIAYLADPTLAKIAIISAFAWRLIPFMMVVSLAAIQSIPQEILEAAEVDGAPYWKRIRFIVLPLTRNALLIVCLLDLVRLFQEITVPWLLTGGGPVYATTPLSLYAYKIAFEEWEFGMASAVGVLWMAFLLIFAVIYVRILIRSPQGAK